MFLKFPDLFVIAISAVAVFLTATINPDATQRKASAVTNFEQSGNTPPIVKILEPKNNSVHSLNSLVPYSISVSDTEDGESRYDEIPAGKILLEIKFIEGSPNSENLQNHNLIRESAGLRLIKNSDCFTCHQFKTRLIGPSFLEIATRYSNTAAARQLLASRITEGSRDIWGEAVMPAHPDITPEESKEIVDWILSNGSNKNLNYLTGNVGSFRIEVPAGARSGFFILKAIYTDKGMPDDPRKTLTGQDVLIIRYE
jgi:cytochrome c